MCRVHHVTSFVGIGGVQVAFISYMAMADEQSRCEHLVYGRHPVAERFGQLAWYRSVRSPRHALRFARGMVARDTVVHFYNNLCSTRLPWLGALPGVCNVLIHERGASWNFPRRDYAETARRNAGMASCLVANSEASRWLMSGKWGLPQERIRVVYNGVLDETARGRLPERREPCDDFTVGFVGRLDSPKGVLTMVDLGQALEGSGIRVKIWGAGVLQEELQSAIEERSLSGNVSFLGAVADPYEAYRQIDILAVPSIREPLGNVAIEAGAVGLPVIAAHVDGLPEVIGDSGVLLEPRKPLRPLRTPRRVPYPEMVVDPRRGELTEPQELDPDELAAEVLALRDDASRRRMLGDALRERVWRMFTMQRYIEEMDDIYREILDGRA